MFIFITAVLVVLVVSFLCSIFESVLLSITRPQVEVLVRQGKRAGTLLADFKEHMDVPIAAILILNTAAHTIGAAVAGASYSNVFDEGTLWIFSLLFTLAVLLFTEIIPKTLGVSNARRLAAPVAHGIQALTILLKPMVVLSERVSRLLRHDNESPVTSAEEIRLLAALGRSEGVVSAGIADMIVGATQIRQLEAHDIMLPREDVKYLHSGMDREEILTLIRETGHSRFPFTTSDSLDDVSGVVMVKTLLDWLLKNPLGDIDWDELCREPLFLPHGAPLPKMLRTFQEGHRHLAIVVDEYGGVEGIATMEDVLEEIVGDIRDESDQPADDIHRMPDGTLRVSANVDLRRLSAELGIAWDPDSEVATIGGLVTEELERIPQRGDAIDWNGYHIEVLRADRRRARMLLVQQSDQPADDE